MKKLIIAIIIATTFTSCGKSKSYLLNEQQKQKVCIYEAPVYVTALDSDSIRIYNDQGVVIYSESWNTKSELVKAFEKDNE